ncbi:golgin subfamily A member 2-like [Oratosquilla oratoria]|uniref:golgin subfamily A member 2-like n=1 Tax=Oratosquilla oratoria TaxID=337810 RepID=UPI003F76C51F
MADTVREQKLAAARRKLRQFQKKKVARIKGAVDKENHIAKEDANKEESSTHSEAGTLSSRASSIDLNDEPERNGEPMPVDEVAEGESIEQVAEKNDLRNQESTPSELLNNEANTSEVPAANLSEAPIANSSEDPTPSSSEVPVPNSSVQVAPVVNFEAICSPQGTAQPVSFSNSLVDNGVKGDIAEVPSVTSVPEPPQTKSITSYFASSSNDVSAFPVAPQTELQCSFLSEVPTSSDNIPSDVQGSVNSVQDILHNGSVAQSETVTAPAYQEQHAQQPVEVHQEQPAEDLHQEQPVEGLHQEQPVEDLHQEQPAEDLHQEQPVEGLHQEQPVEGLHKEQPVEDLHQDQPVQEGSHQEQPTFVGQDQTMMGTEQEDQTVALDGEQVTVKDGEKPVMHQEEPVQELFVCGDEQPVQDQGAVPLGSSPSSQTSMESFEREGSVESETTGSVVTAINVSQGQALHPTAVKSTSESLRQLSLQLSGLMSETDFSEQSVPSSAMEELERRNSELAAKLQEEVQLRQQQSQYITDLKSHIEKVEAKLSLQQEAVSTGGAGLQEVEGLREQLQVHIQTIGILVAEKTELQTNLNHSKHSLQQKTNEVMELEGRLGASRQRLGEIEQQFRDHKSQLSTITTAKENLAKELESLKMTQYKTNKACEEYRTCVSELTEKLNTKTSECDHQTSVLNETRGQLAMAQLHIQQLSSGTTNELTAQMEQMRAAMMESQAQLQATQAALNQSHNENGQLITRYQQYASHLTAQIEELQGQVKDLTKEKEDLQTSLTEAQTTISTLEATSKSGPTEEELKAEREQSRQTITALQEELQQMQAQHQSLVNDNSQLSSLIEEQASKIETLEVNVERSKTEEVDTDQLLATMQSDKVAATRALTQNKQLKEQLEELQNGFILMSNKKLELTEKLEVELHSKKALNKEILGLNEQLDSQRQKVLEKERENQMLRENSDALGKRILSMEIHKKSIISEEDLSKLNKKIALLEGQLNESREYSDNLMKQNGELLGEAQLRKDEIIEEMFAHKKKLEEEEVPKIVYGNEEVEKVEDSNTNTESIPTDLLKQMEMEKNALESKKNNLIPKLEEEQEKIKTLEERLKAAQSEGSSNEGDQSTSFSDLKKAHEALEARFTRSMDQVARLSDENQNLEHTIQKLQIETETIGDYITIYQFQRGVMKQQARERELELTSLRHEREEMRKRLTELQELIASLTHGENGPSAVIDGMKHLVTTKPETNTHPTKEDGEKRLVNGDVDAAVEDHASEVTDKVEGDNQDITVPEAISINKNVEEEKNNSIPTISEKNESVVNKIGQKAGVQSATVKKIFDILNEMETASQKDCTGLQKFHPCPLCSGQLITV